MSIHEDLSRVATAPSDPTIGPALSGFRAREPIETKLVFTGRGGEYFRIWVVNTLLTLLTLGAYSAWAKVRRTRYLWQNTRLDGFVFDYHARPLAILRGRITALVLFVAYTHAFEFSRTVGVVVLIGLCAVGPWLFMRAQQFKLGNSSWRGLRFGFDARTPEAFRIVLPILVLWFSTTVLGVFLTEDAWEDVAMWASFPLLTLAPIPWMHHRLKAYQHNRAWFADRSFSFRPALLRFHATYLKGLLLLALGVPLGVGILWAWLWMSEKYPSFGEAADSPVAFIVGLLTFVAVFVFAWPYLAARLQQVTWSATRLGDIRFHTRIRAGSLMWLALTNTFLTLATCGLYWPFASMRLAKYRIECMSVIAFEPFAQIAAGLHSRYVGAGGDGAADAFGFDIGL